MVRVRQALAVGLVLAAAGCGGSQKPATTAAPPPPKPFRVVFPEGFTRAQMAARVEAVAGIAFHERHVHPRISAKTYLAATAAPRRISGFGSQKRKLEGFLFPATYDFLREHDVARSSCAPSCRRSSANWRTVNLSYARSKNLTPYDVLTIASMVEREAVVPGERPSSSPPSSTTGCRTACRSGSTRPSATA